MAPILKLLDDSYDISIRKCTYVDLSRYAFDIRITEEVNELLRNYNNLSKPQIRKNLSLDNILYGLKYKMN